MTTPCLGPNVLYVLGNALEAAGRGCGFLGTPTGRYNTVTTPRKSDRDWLPVDPPPRGATLLALELTRNDADSPS